MIEAPATKALFKELIQLIEKDNLSSTGKWNPKYLILPIDFYVVAVAASVLLSLPHGSRKKHFSKFLKK